MRPTLRATGEMEAGAGTMVMSLISPAVAAVLAVFGSKLVYGMSRDIATARDLGRPAPAQWSQTYKIVRCLPTNPGGYRRSLLGGRHLTTLNVCGNPEPLSV